MPEAPLSTARSNKTCGDGLISAGDWTQIEGLSTYSGGAWYRKNIHLEKNNRDKVYLNLGQVVSTAEVWINKQKVGLKLTPPWRFNITEYIKEGDNQIEILLYNTAANYYLSVPTMYRGSTKARSVGYCINRNSPLIRDPHCIIKGRDHHGSAPPLFST